LPAPKQFDELYNGLGATPDLRERAYRELFKAHLDQSTLNDVTRICEKGLALGNDRFKREIESLSGRRVTDKKSGPKKKSMI
jgi:putative transposase